MDCSIKEKNIINLNDIRIDQEGEIFLNDDFLSKIRTEIQINETHSHNTKKQVIKNYNRKKKYFKCDLRDDDENINFELFEKSTSEEEEDLIIETKIKKKAKIKPRRKRVIPQRNNEYNIQFEKEQSIQNDEKDFRNIQQEKSNFVDHLNYIFTKDKDKNSQKNNQFCIKLQKRMQ